MAAHSRREHQLGAIAVIGELGVLHRTAGAHIDLAGPGGGYKRIGRQQLAGLAVKHIEKAVLAGLHQHFAIGTVELERGQHDVRRGVIVPALARRGLVVPGVFTVVGIDRNDGRQKQVVARAGAALQTAPGRAVGRTEIDQVGLGIVVDGIPGVTAATALPPLVTLPSGQRGFQRLALLWLGRITRHRIKAPHLLA